MRVNEWINQPVAFWSSLAYLVPILFIKQNTEHTRPWNLCLLVLTLSSMFCHASFIKLSVAMDFASIGIIMGFFSIVHFMKGKYLYPAFTVFFILQVLVNFGLGKWPKIALSILIFLLAFYEVILTYGKGFLRSRNLQLSLLFLSASFLVFLLDDQKIFFCDKTGWFAGHTLWHLGTAASAFFYAKWRFDKTLTARA
jgi:hypothetical protein